MYTSVHRKFYHVSLFPGSLSFDHPCNNYRSKVMGVRKESEKEKGG